jgi:hypothetical protein
MMCIATDAKTIDLRKWAGAALIGQFATAQSIDQLGITVCNLFITKAVGVHCGG